MATAILQAITLSQHEAVRKLVLPYDDDAFRKAHEALSSKDKQMRQIFEAKVQHKEEVGRIVAGRRRRYTIKTKISQDIEEYWNAKKTIALKATISTGDKYQKQPRRLQTKRNHRGTEQVEGKWPNENTWEIPSVTESKERAPETVNYEEVCLAVAERIEKHERQAEEQWETKKLVKKRTNANAKQKSENDDQRGRFQENPEDEILEMGGLSRCSPKEKHKTRNQKHTDSGSHKLEKHRLMSQRFAEGLRTTKEEDSTKEESATDAESGENACTATQQNIESDAAWGKSFGPSLSKTAGVTQKYIIAENSSEGGPGVKFHNTKDVMTSQQANLRPNGERRLLERKTTTVAGSIRRKGTFFLPQVVTGEPTMLRTRKDKPQKGAPDKAKAWALPAHCYEWKDGESDEEPTDFDTENEQIQTDSGWSSDEDENQLNESAATATGSPGVTEKGGKQAYGKAGCRFKRSAAGTVIDDDYMATDARMMQVLIARDVSKSEMRAHKEALLAQEKEWRKLWDQKVWGETVVRSWNQIAIEARRTGKYIHLGKLFGICVENWSELPDGVSRKNTNIA